MKNLFQSVYFSIFVLLFFGACQGMEDAQIPMADDSNVEFTGDENARKGQMMEFGSFLIGTEEVPAVNSSGAGAAFFSLSPDGKSLNFEVRVANTTGIIFAHLHNAAEGENGPVVVTLIPAQDPSGLENGVVVEGMIKMEDLSGPLDGKMISDLVREINMGRIYVNIHTSSFPSGELRGQVSMVQPNNNDNFTIKLSGLNEFPAVETDATGVAIFRFNKKNSSVEFQVNVDNISDIRFSHIHLAEPGANGPVVVTLDGEKREGPVEGVYVKGTLTSESLGGKLMGGDLMILREAMRTSYAYVNVHSDLFPSGELRGNF